MSGQQPTRKCLWKANVGKEGSASQQDDFLQNDAYETILQRFATKPRQKSLFELCSNSLVVVQEISLSCYFLARHELTLRQESSPKLIFAERHFLLEASAYLIMLALILVFFYSSRSDQTNQLKRSTKLRQRSKDAFLLGLLLRFSAGLLQSLTASYSSDTVQSLAFFAMILHVLFCDFSYANGNLTIGSDEDDSDSLRPKQNKALRRPPFLGGTVSLNAALFSTTLLVSRLQSNTQAYTFMALAIVMFAFYPVTRHAIAASYPPYLHAAMWIISFLIIIATSFLLLVLGEESSSSKSAEWLLVIIYFTTIVVIGFILPLWKYFLQRYKILLRGPWDIPTAASMRLDYSISSDKED